MLESPASQRYIQSLISYDKHERRPSTSHRLAELTIFRWSDDIEESENYKSKLPGVTLGLTSQRARLLHSGICNNIIIRHEPFKLILDAERRSAEDGIAKGMTTELNRLRFMLAKTLCHEVIHGFDMLPSAPCSHYSVRHHWEDQSGSEVGDAWENEVFGACAIGNQPMTTWHFFEGQDWLRPSNYPDIIKADGLTYWNVTDEDTPNCIARVQRQEFWDEEKRIEGIFVMPSMTLREGEEVWRDRFYATWAL
ncbi:MAG: hypothetical protein Q9181_004671 [Wetmoreana brouardii]